MQADGHFLLRRGAARAPEHQHAGATVERGDSLAQDALEDAAQIGGAQAGEFRRVERPGTLCAEVGHLTAPAS